MENSINIQSVDFECGSFQVNVSKGDEDSLINISIDDGSEQAKNIQMKLSILKDIVTAAENMAGHDWGTMY